MSDVENDHTSHAIEGRLEKLEGAIKTATVASDSSCVDGRLGKMSGTNMVDAGTTPINVPLFPIVSGGGTASVSYATAGQISLQFDGATTAGDYVGLSTSAAGKATDIGSSIPLNTWIIGQVLSTNGGAGTYAVQLAQGFDPPAPPNLTATVVLTDAQIKALPTTPIILVSAPGAGKMLLLDKAIVTASFAQVYAGFDANNSFGIDNVEQNFWVLQNQTQNLLGFLAAGIIMLPPFSGSAINALQNPLSGFADKPIRFFVTQDDTGLAYTAGDPANTLTITVYYSVVTLP